MLNKRSGKRDIALRVRSTLTISVNDRQFPAPVDVARRTHRHRRGTLKAKLLSAVCL
jgi:hypothetical protein